MKSLSKLIANICIFLFCLGTAASAYMLYLLPEDIITHAPAIHINQLVLADAIFNRLYLTIGLTLMVGMLTITFMLVFRAGHQHQYASVSEKNTKHAEDISMQEEQHNDAQKIYEIEDLVQTSDDKEMLFTKALSSVCMQLEASQAVAYEIKQDEDVHFVEMFASYAYYIPEGKVPTYHLGEGIVGQAAKDGKLLNINAVPDGYLSVVSGLGKATPKHLLVLPLKNDQVVVGVIEIASFKEISNNQAHAVQKAFKQLALKLANNDNVSLAQAKL